ncbi:coadhesin-like [Babylonia areolata]|uniref:coadhesin-like n=1 Tax=Babylonia areolata TaxID=304850 RepID=UPI003FD522F0
MYTSIALEHVRTHTFTPIGGDRPGVPNVAVILTDGQSPSFTHTAHQAALAHEAGIAVFVFGIGRSVSRKEMNVMASDPDEEHVIAMSNFSQLRSRGRIFLGRLCRPGGAATVDGQWSGWGPWSTCSVTCDTGSRSRSRTCDNPPAQSGGRPCSGAASDVTSCSLPSCPVDGQWSGWGPWSTCSVTCDTGSRSRSRTCDNPPAQFGGRPCSGAASDVTNCSLPSCPVDGQWSGWGPWSTCSVTCDTGSRSRSRTCDNPPAQFGGRPCSGAASDVTNCSLPSCPVDGQWSVWGPWSTCSVTCDTGSRSRSRSCDNPPAQFGGRPCSGAASDVTNCSLPSCPVDGQWSVWGPWSTCSVTCDTGSRSRSRTCDNPPAQFWGRPCSGAASDVTNCSLPSCPGQVDGQWSVWGPWSTCSVTCDTGSRSRSRTCDNPPAQFGGRPCSGAASDVTNCSLPSCPVDGQWSGWGPWSTCSVTCDTGSRSRSRTCDKPPAQFGGRPCSGAASDVTNCSLPSCPVDGQWSSWGPWSTCSVTCDTGSRSRSRTCDNPPAQFGGRPCSGAASDVTNCSLPSCPVEVQAEWDSWAEWGQCIGQCDSGLQHRRRNCTNPALFKNATIQMVLWPGQHCAGTSNQTRTCPLPSCQQSGDKTATIAVIVIGVLLVAALVGSGVAMRTCRSQRIGPLTYGVAVDHVPCRLLKVIYWERRAAQRTLEV